MDASGKLVRPWSLRREVRSGEPLKGLVEGQRRLVAFTIDCDHLILYGTWFSPSVAEYRTTVCQRVMTVVVPCSEFPAGWSRRGITSSWSHTPDYRPWWRRAPDLPTAEVARKASGKGSEYRTPRRRPYLNDSTSPCTTSVQPSTRTNSNSLNGSATMVGGSMNIPMLISTDATTTSITMKGRNSAKPT